MVTRTLRKIVTIDEEKCDGCGVCIPACAEGALQIIDGKAKLIAEKYCDGLGACLGECPQGAITVEERVAEGFDEEATKLFLEGKEHPVETLACGCPATSVTEFQSCETAVSAPAETATPQQMLRHWPIQLALVPPGAPFLQGADLVLAADCAPFAYAGFYRDFMREQALLVACPKLDDYPAHLKKLTDIIKQSSVKSLTVAHMEVPCCSGLVQMARQAMQLAGKDIPLREVTIGIKGELVHQL